MEFLSLVRRVAQRLLAKGLYNSGYYLLLEGSVGSALKWRRKFEATIEAWANDSSDMHKKHWPEFPEESRLIRSIELCAVLFSRRFFLLDAGFTSSIGLYTRAYIALLRSLYRRGRNNEALSILAHWKEPSLSIDSEDHTRIVVKQLHYQARVLPTAFLSKNAQRARELVSTAHDLKEGLAVRRLYEEVVDVKPGAHSRIGDALAELNVVLQSRQSSKTPFEAMLPHTVAAVALVRLKQPGAAAEILSEVYAKTQFPRGISKNATSINAQIVELELARIKRDLTRGEELIVDLVDKLVQLQTEIKLTALRPLLGSMVRCSITLGKYNRALALIHAFAMRRPFEVQDQEERRNWDILYRTLMLAKTLRLVQFYTGEVQMLGELGEHLQIDHDLVGQDLSKKSRASAEDYGAYQILIFLHAIYKQNGQWLEDRLNAFEVYRKRYFVKPYYSRTRLMAIIINRIALFTGSPSEILLELERGLRSFASLRGDETILDTMELIPYEQILLSLKQRFRQEKAK